MGKIINFPGFNRTDASAKIIFSQQLLSYLQNTPFDPERLIDILHDTIVDVEVLTFLGQQVNLYNQGEEINEVEIRKYLYDKVGPAFTEIISRYYDDNYLLQLIELTKEDLKLGVLDVDTDHLNQIKKLYIQDIENLFSSHSASSGYLSGVKKTLAQELAKVA